MKGYFFLFARWLRGEVFSIPGRVIALVFFVGLFLLPVVNQDPYYLRIASLTIIFAMFAASWDVLAGYAGQLNLGHGLFFSVAAYSAALINIHLHWSPWLTIPIGAVAAVLVGLIVGIPALRLRGMYLALVTLSFPLILVGMVFLFSDITGGELGLFGVSVMSSSKVGGYYIIALTFAVSIFIMYKFTDAKSKYLRVGLLLNALGEDEIAARTSGINTVHYKLLAFAVSGFFAGIAGGLYTHYLRIAGPATLELFFSFNALLWTIFGGLGTIYGAVVGVFILYPLTEILSLYKLGEQIRFLVLAVILILTLLFMPEGISVWVLDKIEVKCPRCKLVNVFWRKQCRSCRAELYPEKSKGQVFLKGRKNDHEISI
jgi:branched-chain amino acid transport system permease protein